MKMKKWMGACLMASMVLTQSPVSVLANEFTEVDQTNLEMINEAEGQKVFIGKTGYDSISSAIDAATDGQTIVVKGNITESVTIPASKKLSLEIIEGAKLTNTDKQNTITVSAGATLTITGKGTIENVSDGKAALVNNGTAYLNGAKFTRNIDTHQEEGDKVNNSFYTVQNLGTMEVNHATIHNAGKHSSCITNGWFSPNEAADKKATLTINDGAYIEGGVLSVKNDENGFLYIKGGTIVGKQKETIRNWNVAEISGGTITNTNPSGTAIRNASSNYNDPSTGTKSTSIGDLKIKGGTIQGQIALENTGESTYKGGSLTIEGGTIIGEQIAINEKKTINDKTQAYYEASSTTITSGDIKGKLSFENASTLTVTGGTFTDEIPNGANQNGSTAHVHKIVKVSKDPTCTEPGVEEHYECTVCHKTYLDEKGLNDLAKPTEIPATGHTYTWVIDKEPTKDEAGVKYQYCVVCHHKTDPVSIPAIGYTEKVENAVYRAYNPNNGEHLYTTNYDEFMHITNIGWHDEGVSFMTEANKEGNPVYRVYNPNSGLHHYTTDENEKNTLVSLGWHDEKVSWYASNKPQSAPVFRVYNPNGGQHHYTMNQQEKNALVSYGWHDEGIAFRTSLVPTK